MATKSKPGTGPISFEAVVQAEVPKGRDGKHKQIILRLLNDIALLKEGTALKVPLSALPDTKENIRSALNRATRQRGIEVATASDTDYLYVWKSHKKGAKNGNLTND
jgi:hypothetical protein